MHCGARDFAPKRCTATQSSAPDGDRRELTTLLRLVDQVLGSTGLGRDPAAGRLLAASRELASSLV